MSFETNSPFNHILTLITVSEVLFTPNPNEAISIKKTYR